MLVFAHISADVPAHSWPTVCSNSLGAQAKAVGELGMKCASRSFMERSKSSQSLSSLTVSAQAIIIHAWPP
jgi:hypothetical protein